MESNTLLDIHPHQYGHIGWYGHITFNLVLIQCFDLPVAGCGHDPFHNILPSYPLATWPFHMNPLYTIAHTLSIPCNSSPHVKGYDGGKLVGDALEPPAYIVCKI